MTPHFLTTDPVVIAIPVTFEDGSGLTTLDGATVAAWARQDGASAAVQGSVAVSGDIITATWAASTFAQGNVMLQAFVNGVALDFGGAASDALSLRIRVQASLVPDP